MVHQDCSPSVCAHGSWTCGDGSCVISDSICDGTNDCSDGSDEANCGEMPQALIVESHSFVLCISHCFQNLQSDCPMGTLDCLRCATIKNGEQCVMISLEALMPMLHVSILVISKCNYMFC